jgi:hypothetical protein
MRGFGFSALMLDAALKPAVQPNDGGHEANALLGSKGIWVIFEAANAKQRQQIHVLCRRGKGLGSDETV